MEMTEVYKKLQELQKILSEKYKIQAEKDEAPRTMERQGENVTRRKKENNEISEQYLVAREKVAGLKRSLEEAIKSREEGEKGMDNISTNREYEALEKQITEATQRETEFRKELQVEEKNLADLEERLKFAEADLKEQEEEFEKLRKELDGNLKKYDKQLADLEKKENNVTPGIDQEIVYKFQRIIQRNSQGIVAVKNGVCDGCHMILPAQFANEVRAGDKILFCPYCSRILYYEESEEGEEDYSMISTGFLADDDDDTDGSDDDDSTSDDEYRDDEDSDSENEDDENEDEDEDSDESEE